jgi:voltage-gated potassium channel
MKRLNLQTATDTLRELALAYVTLVVVSALLFMAIENQPFLDSLYWAGTTATSTGYGDVAPHSWAGKALALALMHISIFGVAPMIVVRLVERLNDNRDAFTHEEQELIMARLARIEAMLSERAPGADEAKGE